MLTGAALWYIGVPRPFLIPALVLSPAETVSSEPALDLCGGIAFLE